MRATTSAGACKPLRAIAALAAAIPIATIAFAVDGTLSARVAHAASATVNEFPVTTASSGLEQIAKGPDGNLWFTETGANNIGRITPNGTISEYAVPTASSSPVSITAGSDGNLWFTENGADKIGQITPSGAFQEFPVLTSGSAVNGITAGADGNLWFTEHFCCSGNIGRVTTGGSVTEYPGACLPNAIAGGPDGNLWFTDDCGEIGRITTSGAVTMFVVPCYCVAITTGPDGNLWAAGQDTTRASMATILVLATNGSVVAQYQPPTATAHLNGITAGANGALWFTEDSGTIGEVSTAGAITEFAVPSAGADPFGITSGPDGNVWFTESGTNAIGQLVVPASCTNVLVGVSHATLGPGIPETVTPVLANCGSNALPSTTVSTNTTPPGGCGAAPAFPSFAAAVGPGASVSGPSTFMPNSCQGVYTVTSQATADGSVVASATTTYTMAPVGTGVEYPTIDRPNAVVAGPDGTVWASEGSDTKVLQSYSPSGVIKTFHAPSGTINLLDLATGGDGNVYVIDFMFASSGTSRVLARVTPTGTFTLIPLPKNASAVTAVAAGPQGDIWVAVSTPSGTRIGRLTANGTIKLLPPVGTPGQLTAGPDGAVWFTSGSSLGRITENGTSNTFALPPGITAGLITQGADGNMWYLGGDSSGNNVVGSMSTEGVAGPVYPTPVSGGLYGFATGADGNLWYNEAYGGNVDRVTPQGVFTQFSAPNPSGNAKSIAAGPDGNIWLGEYYGFNVAQVSTGAPSACTPVSVTVNPFASPGGSTETVTTTITNCATVPRFLHVDTATTAPGGCIAPPKTAEHVALQPRVSTAETVSTATPTCPGTYRVKSTLSIGGKVVAAASATYQVT